MANVYPHAYFKDRIVPFGEANVSVGSAAVLYGLSVYTVFFVSKTKEGLKAFRLDDHFARLQNSSRIIGIDTFETEWNPERFKKVVSEVIAANALDKDVFVRVTIHADAVVPGVRSRGLSTALSIFIYDANPILPKDGARLKTSVWRRIPDFSIPSRAKVNGAYVNSVLARQDAVDSGYDDCVFLDFSGHVCELSAANIFLVRDGKLITPHTASDILEGINRKTILEIAREDGMTVHERSVDLTELYVADEVFACGTSAFISSVKEVDARVIGGGVPGPVTKKLRERYEKIMKGDDPLSDSYLTAV